MDQELLQKIFLKYDKDQDHLLDASEAKQILMDLNYKNEVSQGEIEATIRNHVYYEDHRIGFDELQEMVNKTYRF